MKKSRNYLLLIFRKTKIIITLVTLRYKINRRNQRSKMLLLLHYRKLIIARSVYRIVVQTALILLKLLSRVAMSARMVLLDKIPSNFNVKTTNKSCTSFIIRLNNNSIIYHNLHFLISNKTKQHTQPNPMFQHYPITPITVKITSDHHYPKAKI